MSKRSRRGSRSRREERKKRRKEPMRPPDCPSSFRCHQCEGNHWTIQCPRILKEPHRYPKIDVERGCFQCGQRGHKGANCVAVREKCAECGGKHSTQTCPFMYAPQEWHEFYDLVRQHVYYCHSESHERSWEVPPNPNDVILWHCDACKILMPDDLEECVQCKVRRRRTVETSSSSSSSDDDDDDEDNGVGSGEEEEEGPVSKEASTRPDATKLEVAAA